MTSLLFTIADLVLVQCLAESGHANICQSNEQSCSTSPVIKEMQIKTTIRYHYSSIKLTNSEIIYGMPLVVECGEIIHSLMVGE